jgi:aquaporin Z
MTRRMTRRPNWTEYGLEALGVALFMLSAGGFGVLLFHPDSPVVQAIPAALPRRALMGAAMALTALLNTYSPWGRRSGSHLNPAVTLTFWRLGKVSNPDLAGYVTGQFLGAGLGIAVAALLFRRWIGDPAVNYVATVPGAAGPLLAFLAELGMTFVVMTVVLTLMARPKAAPYTGLAVAGLVFLFITFETPISGMSLNPARSAGSAALAMTGGALWIYFLAPPLGMLAAAALGRRRDDRAHCAKLIHDARYDCPFCGHRSATAPVG